MVRSKIRPEDVPTTSHLLNPWHLWFQICNLGSSASSPRRGRGAFCDGVFGAPVRKGVGRPGFHHLPGMEMA
jgi:hypothetical protein